MTIIGLTGGIGHGKTTFAADLAACAPSFATYESSLLISEVANDLRSFGSPRPDDIDALNTWLTALPDILATRTHATTDIDTLKITPERLKSHPEYYEKLFEYLRDIEANPVKANSVITPENKDHFRTLLQWLGGYLAKVVDGGIWYREIIRRIQEAPPVDLALIGGVRFPADAAEIRKAGGLIIEVQRPNFGDQDKNDLTERERASIVPDITILNDGSLLDLKDKAQQTYEDIVSAAVNKH
ncbi:MAG TPA: hypothetical protein VF401_04815 [Candidatus Saccharimonadales bacterium]